MSTETDQGSNNIEIMTDVADVDTDTTMEAVAFQAPVVNEVAITAAHDYLPVKVFEYLINAVHYYTGLNWWAAIALTTLLIKCATLPWTIYRHKAYSKHHLIKPHLKQIKQTMKCKAIHPAEGKKQMQKLYKDPDPSLTRLVIEVTYLVSFTLAITSMAEKVPSFKNGGAYWFLDLTTPDFSCILPVLYGLLFIAGVPCKEKDKDEHTFLAVVIAASTIFMGFPKAVYFSWITSCLFSLGYRLVLKVPGVKKTLGFPEIPAPQLKLPGPKISSLSIISQRLRNLEKQGKRRKKNKKSRGKFAHD